MAKLMTASTSLTQLRSKYDDFQAPAIRIEIDGTEIVEGCGASIGNAEIELTSDYPASGCTFEVLGAYEPESTGFSQKLDKLLQLGAKARLSVGYVTTEAVFSGYITKVSYRFGGDSEAPVIRVECIDVKGLMMKVQRLEIFKEDSIAGAVRTILREKPYNDYVGLTHITDTSQLTVDIQSVMETDYDFIVRQAKKLGFEFFTFLDEVYFRPVPRQSSPVLTLSPEDGLLSVEFSLSAGPLVDQVEMRGIGDGEGKAVQGIARASGKFSAGGSAARMMSGTRKVFYEADIASADQARRRADVILDQYLNQFGRLEGKTFGLPELVPGRSIALKGLIPRANTSFYITGVRHELGNDGFYTCFEGRINSL